MLPSIGMEPTRRTAAASGAGKQPSSRELAEKKQALQEAQRRQRHTLTRQIRRAQARLSAADRKRRTRRLILIGSYIEHTTQADPAASMTGS